MLLVGFLLGILFTILSILLFFAVFLRTKHDNITSASTTSRGDDPQLSLNGRLRISKELLSISDVLEKSKNKSNSFITWSDKIHNAMTKTRQLSGFLISRFLGDSSAVLKIPDEMPKPYQDVYAILKHKTLYLYSNEDKLECLNVLLIPQYKVCLFPDDLAEHELFMPQNPILIKIQNESVDRNLYIYTSSSLEKEDWYIILKRASNLPAFADSGALSTFYQEKNTVKQYADAMKKLVESSKGEMSATAWLNAFVGRL